MIGCGVCCGVLALLCWARRRTADTQKLTQNILAANDQRLMAIGLCRQQQAAARAAATQQASAHGCSKAASAAQLLKAAEVHGHVAAWEHLAEEDDASSWGGAGDSSLEGSFHGGGHSAAAAAVRPKRRKSGLGHRASRTELQDIPFGLLVLEVLLDATAGAAVGNKRG